MTFFPSADAAETFPECVSSRPQVDPTALEKCLTQRAVTTARDTVNKPLNSDQALDGRDAFVKVTATSSPMFSYPLSSSPPAASGRFFIFFIWVFCHRPTTQRWIVVKVTVKVLTFIFRNVGHCRKCFCLGQSG